MSQVRALERDDDPPARGRLKPKLSSWSMRLPARWARAALWELLLEPFVRIFYDLRAVGLENLERTPGPVIFAANHCAHLDNGFIIMALPFRWRRRLAIAAASADIFGPRHFGLPIKGALARLIGNAFPFTRSRAPARVDFFRSLLEQNWSILVFPEGRLTVCGPMRPFKAGVGLMAVESGVPVVPVRVDIKRRGPWEGAGRLSRGEVEVRFGEPRLFEADEDPEAATAWIEEAVRKL
jgi:1-acyl-sn-glycerol-3-phosphate acyltransferase